MNASSHSTQRRVGSVVIGTISCLAIFASTKHIVLLSPEIFGRSSITPPPLKNRLPHSGLKQKDIPNIPHDANLILVLAESCTKCSAIVLSYGKRLEHIFGPTDYKIVLVTKDTQSEIDFAKVKSPWSAGNVISDSQGAILTSLGNPDMPQVIVFKNGNVEFSGKSDESLKQSLYRLCIEKKIPPRKMDDGFDQGAVPCSVK